MIAASNGKTQVAETLIGHGADVNAKDKVFCQLLWYYIIFDFLTV